MTADTTPPAFSSGEEAWDFDSLLLLIDTELEGSSIENTDRRGKLLHAARVNIRNWLAARGAAPAPQGTANDGDKYFESFTALYRAIDILEPSLTGPQWKHIAKALLEVGAKYGAVT